jgi:hypothetical protein
MTRIPSIASLETHLQLTPEAAKAVHLYLRRDQPHRASTAGEFCGVEYAYDSSGRLAFQYLNAGETYATTLVKRPQGDWRISTMGDEISALRRRGTRFD